MAVLVSHPPNTDTFTASYNYYRATAAGGPFTLVGSNDQDTLAASIDFLDANGTVNHFYRVTAVDVSGFESQSTATLIVESTTTTRVYDTITDPTGRGIPNISVQAKISDVAFFGGILIPQEAARTVTDVNGYWFLDLFPNVNLVPSSTYYTILIPGVMPARRILVPVATSSRFQTIIQA